MLVVVKSDSADDKAAWVLHPRAQYQSAHRW